MQNASPPQLQITGLTAQFAGGAGVFDVRMTVPAGGRTVFEGSAGLVSKQAPHGFTIVTPDAEGFYEVAGSLGGQAHPASASLGEAARWRVLLPPNITQPVLVRALAARGAPVLGIEPIKADLEIAFWNLAAARERRAA